MNRLAWVLFGWPGNWRIRVLISAVLAAIISSSPDVSTMLVLFVILVVTWTAGARIGGWRRVPREADE